MTLHTTSAKPAFAKHLWHDTVSRFIVLIERTLRPWGLSPRA
jgi:hypothetical protein